MINDNLFHDIIGYSDEKFPLLTRKMLLRQNHLNPALPAWHEDIEIKYFLRGRARVHVGEEELDVGEGDILITNPYENHYTIVLEEDVEYRILIANIRQLSELLAEREGAQRLTDISNGAIKFRHVVSCKSDMGTILVLLLDEMERAGESSRFSVLSLALALFFHMLSHEISICSLELMNSQISRQQKIEPALAYLREHYCERCSEAELARLCGIERVYFSKLFKRTTGITVHGYIDRLRLGMAQMLLETTSQKMSVVAEAAGFQNESYFYRWFRNQTGCTPHEYRSRFG